MVQGLVLDVSGRVLLVSHAPSEFWYAPGGHLRDGESLTRCLTRELHEETGITVEYSGVVLVDQVVERENHEDKLEVYFLGAIREMRSPTTGATGAVP
jgi:ADP-ribose pyrophosphatase YjhB (NUDIX family)